MKTLDEVAIFMPEDIGEALRQVFSMKDMGQHEFEGAEFYRSLCAFAAKLQSDDMCRINIPVNDQLSRQVYMICPIDTAAHNVLFFQDQLTENPQMHPFARTRMRDVLLGLETPSKPFDCGDGIVMPSKNIIGWFDLDNLVWIFTNVDTFAKFFTGVRFGQQPAKT